MQPALPEVAYRPGCGAEPDRIWLERAKGALCHDALVEQGFGLVRSGYFWEAHELLEHAWKAVRPNARERDGLRAIIQIANALLKQETGRPKAALRLYAEAAQLLRGIASRGPVLGLDTVRLAALAARAAEAGPHQMGVIANEIRAL